MSRKYDISNLRVFPHPLRLFYASTVTPPPPTIHPDQPHHPAYFWLNANFQTHLCQSCEWMNKGSLVCEFYQIADRIDIGKRNNGLEVCERESTVIHTQQTCLNGVPNNISIVV